MRRRKLVRCELVVVLVRVPTRALSGVYGGDALVRVSVRAHLRDSVTQQQPLTTRAMTHNGGAVQQFVCPRCELCITQRTTH